MVRKKIVNKTIDLPVSQRVQGQLNHEKMQVATTEEMEMARQDKGEADRLTDAERRALLDSAKMAGLNVLKLMNDSTAIARANGIYKQDLPETDKPSRNVVFVDCGHTGTMVSAASFNKGKLTMLSMANASAGGRDFDEAISKYFVKDFLERYKLNVPENKKATLKLMTEAEKLKKLMSANTNKIPLNIECFMEDKDVKGIMDRAIFEELVALSWTI